MEDYRYELNYINDATKVSMTFSADLSVWELGARLKEFLCAAGWDEKCLARILDIEDLKEYSLEEYRKIEEEDNE